MKKRSYSVSVVAKRVLSVEFSSDKGNYPVWKVYFTATVKQKPGYTSSMDITKILNQKDYEAIMAYCINQAAKIAGWEDNKIYVTNDEGFIINAVYRFRLGSSDVESIKPSNEVIIKMAKKIQEACFELLDIVLTQELDIVVSDPE